MQISSTLGSSALPAMRTRDGAPWELWLIVGFVGGTDMYLQRHGLSEDVHTKLAYEAGRAIQTHAQSGAGRESMSPGNLSVGLHEKAST